MAPDRKAERVLKASSNEQSSEKIALDSAIEILRKADRIASHGKANAWTGSEQVALEWLYKRYRLTMLRVARRCVTRFDRAEDVIHDVFLRLPGYLTRYQDGHFEAWLARVVRRRALTAVKRDARLAPLSDAFPLLAVEETHKGSLTRDRLRIAICRLPRNLRVVVALRCDAGLCHAEIGWKLGISAAASAARYSRAVKQLRWMLTQT